MKANNVFSVLYRTRVKVQKDDTPILNLSLIFSIIAVCSAPWLAVIGLVVALVLGYRFSIERNAAELIAQLLKERGWGIDKVTKHQDYSGKYCPHRTLDMGWQRFLDMVQGYLDGEGATSSPSKSVDEIAQEVIAGKWGNGSERRERLTAAGYDYSTVQARVNEIMGGGSASATPAKSVDEVAQEVIAGKWGNGSDRKDRLTAAGYDYSQVQARVNELLGGSSDSSTSNSIAVGDTVRITCNTYSTGQSVPSWVKNTTHKVSQIKGDKALLGYPDGIASWVPLSGIVRA